MQRSGGLWLENAEFRAAESEKLDAQEREAVAKEREAWSAEKLRLEQAIAEAEKQRSTLVGVENSRLGQPRSHHQKVEACRACIHTTCLPYVRPPLRRRAKRGMKK